MNKYNVVYIEVTAFISKTLRDGGTLSDVSSVIINTLSRDLDGCFGAHLKGKDFIDKIIAVVEESRKRLERSEKLFEDTINMNEEAVAEAIECVHREETSLFRYNREESLRLYI